MVVAMQSENKSEIWEHKLGKGEYNSCRCIYLQAASIAKSVSPTPFNPIHPIGNSLKKQKQCTKV